MLIIGERINSTRVRINEALKRRDAAFIAREARLQHEAGAHFIDINCAVTSGSEEQEIDWAISVVQSELPGVSISIDSPNYLAIDRALGVYKGSGQLIINSITADAERIGRIAPLARAHRAGLIALTMDERGMPDTVDERVAIAGRMLEMTTAAGIDPAMIYFDPLIRPVATEPSQAARFLEAIPRIKELGPVKTVCGLSNVSFGLPRRSVVNGAFLAMALKAGLDAAILDPLDKQIVSSLRASAALLGQDEFCGEYIRAFREGKLA